MKYGGIDPGKNGAFAIIDGSNVIIGKLEPIDKFILMIKKIGPEIFFGIEKQHAFPKQGVSSTFTLGENFGFIKGILKSHKVSFFEITPSSWKRAFGLMKAPKQVSIEKANEIIRNDNFNVNKEIETPDEAEAFLIAYYTMKK